MNLGISPRDINIRFNGLGNRVPRIFGLKKEQVTGGWRNLHNEELLNAYSSPEHYWDQIFDKVSRHVALMENMRNATGSCSKT
jgi:hypothetical protein